MHLVCLVPSPHIKWPQFPTRTSFPHRSREKAIPEAASHQVERPIRLKKSKCRPCAVNCHMRLIEFFFFLFFNRLVLAQCYAGTFTPSLRYCGGAFHHTVRVTESRKDRLSTLDLCLTPQELPHTLTDHNALRQSVITFKMEHGGQDRAVTCCLPRHPLEVLRALCMW